MDVFREQPFSFEDSELPEERYQHGSPPPDADLRQAQEPDEWFDGMQKLSDEWTTRLEERRRQASSGSTSTKRESEDVATRIFKWRQLESINNNRRLEGLPPLTQLADLPQGSQEPPVKKIKSMPQQQQTEYFDMSDQEGLVLGETPQATRDKDLEVARTEKLVQEGQELHASIVKEKNEETSPCGNPTRWGGGPSYIKLMYGKQGGKPLVEAFFCITQGGTQPPLRHAQNIYFFLPCLLLPAFCMRIAGVSCKHTFITFMNHY